MKLRTIEIESSAGGRTNEDRAGLSGALAWVIDGATDVLPRPLTRAPSDASWFAGEMHRLLSEETEAVRARPLTELPSLVATELAARFAKATSEPPSGPQDHPSAAGIVVRLEQEHLSYVSLGDCALMIDTGTAFHVVGDDPAKAGDRWVAEALTQTEMHQATSPTGNRDQLWPMLHRARAAMNSPEGYGIFSITAPPQHFIRHGCIPVCAETRILLASDGIMRLVDVFKRYDAKGLFEAALHRGLLALLDELRAIESSDPSCLRFPRAKVSDDATALVLEIS